MQLFMIQHEIVYEKHPQNHSPRFGILSQTQIFQSRDCGVQANNHRCSFEMTGRYRPSRIIDSLYSAHRQATEQLPYGHTTKLPTRSPCSASRRSRDAEQGAKNPSALSARTAIAANADTDCRHTGQKRQASRLRRRGSIGPDLKGSSKHNSTGKFYRRLAQRTTI